MFKHVSQQMYKNELILKFFFKKIFNKYNTLISLLLLYFIPLLGSFVIGFFEGTIENREVIINGKVEQFIGIKNDYTNYVLPLVIVIVINMLNKFSRFIKFFLSHEINEITYKYKLEENFIDTWNIKLTKMFAPRGMYKVIKIALVVIFILLWLSNAIKGFDPIKYYKVDIWHSWYHPIGFIYLKTFNLVYVGILLPLFFYYFTIFLIGFSMLFKQISQKDGFIIKPLFPDKCGGLKILSKLSLYFMYMVVPFFLIFISIILRGTPFVQEQKIGILALTFLLFVTFFLPLSAVHGAMKRAKAKELEIFAEKFSILRKKIKNDLDNRIYSPSFAHEVEALEKLDYLYTKSSNMPVWPFDFSSLRKLFTATLLPFFIFLLEQLTNPDSIIYNLDKFKNFFLNLSK